MEAFSLLKYWRGGGGAAPVDGGANVRAAANNGVTTIVTAVTSPTETDDDNDGPFFDLEFAVPDEEQEKDKSGNCTNRTDLEDSETDNTDGENENEGEFKFTLSSGDDDGAERNVQLSPSDDLFFKGQLVPVDPGSDPNPKSQFSLLKSATKFRVLMLKLKKSKENVGEKTETKQEESQQKQKSDQNHSKFYTVKCKIEEIPIKSVFKRDASSRSSSAGTNKSEKQQCSDEPVSDEKGFSKDVMQRYMKMVRPFYVRVSKRYGTKLNFSGNLNVEGGKTEASPPSSAEKISPKLSPASNVKGQKQGSFPVGLSVVSKRLGKSRSAPSPAGAAPQAGTAQASRRDDSLLQQQDGIQSAILHCKRSFNAPRDSDSSILSRSVSDSSHDKSTNPSENCSEQPKDK